MKLAFSQKIFENSQISNFMKIRPVGVEFFADGRTDRNAEGNSRFLQFCERVQKQDESSLESSGFGSWQLAASCERGK